MPCSTDICLKLHKFFVTKNSKLDICKVSAIVLEYISNMIKVSSNLTKNEYHVFKQQYFDELLYKSLAVKAMANELLSVIDEQIPRIEQAILECKAEKERIRLEKEKAYAEAAEKIWTAPVALAIPGSEQLPQA